MSTQINRVVQAKIAFLKIIGIPIFFQKLIHALNLRYGYILKCQYFIIFVFQVMDQQPVQMQARNQCSAIDMIAFALCQ